MGFFEKYFGAVNGLLLILGLVLLGYSAYLLADVGDVAAGIADYSIVTPLSMGALLVLVSGLGCIGMQKNIKVILLVYFCIALVLTCITLGTGVTLLAFGGALEKVKNGDEIQNSIMGQIVDYEIALFNGCCGDQVGDYEVTCGGNITSYCISNAEGYASFLEYVNDDLCEILSLVEIDGVPLVGNVTEEPGTCGAGDIQQFIDGLSSYVEDNFNLFGGVNLGISIALLLLLLSALCLMFKKDQKPAQKKETQNEEMVAQDILG